MATKLTKVIRREMLSGVGMERGKHARRGLIVELHPGDELVFRVKGTRQKYSIYLGQCFRLAQLFTIEAEYKAKMKAYAENRKFKKGLRRPKRPMMPFSKIYFDAIGKVN